MSVVRAVSCLKSTHMPSMAVRYASAAAAPGKSKVQLQKPPGESVTCTSSHSEPSVALQGFFSYDRNISRDPKLKGVPKPHPGDTLASFDFEGRSRKRCELMEILQDEMLQAAKKRGTR
uniref:39S ribosomal protein L52, mitochondrial n=1 Tax=Angiostrongylus cantonensis TaxID=6313 RepID=A0A0K0CT23_ANGCA